jgi:phosphotriesterase-related protein
MTGQAIATVETVNGPVPVDGLGRVLMHEHIFSFHSDLSGDYGWEQEQLYIESAIDKLRRLKAAGFGTVVDLTAIGLGRNVARVARVAASAGVHVVAATGIYASCCMPVYFRRNLVFESPMFMEDHFVREIEEGIGATGVRAAMIKCVTDREGLTPDVEFMLRATARAHLRTGVPISTHTDPFAETGLIQQRVFRQEGVDLSAVIIGHSGDTDDLDYLQRLLDAGSYLGLDRFGDYRVTSLERRVRTVAALCDRGYASRLVLSHDANCGGDVLPGQSLENWYFGHIPQVVLPALHEYGVSDDDLELMLTANPEAIFAASATRAAAISSHT